MGTHVVGRTTENTTTALYRREGELLPRSPAKTDAAYYSWSVDVLPDDILLEIFDFDRLFNSGRWQVPWKWHRLAHVCQRWRRVVFSSPRRLNLRLVCSRGTPVNETLRFWPALPISMRYGGFAYARASSKDEENLVTALRHPDRICEFGLMISGPTGSMGNRLVAEMQKTMPSPETLNLDVNDDVELLLPDEFLGGSAPLLTIIELSGVAFPALPKLLLSTSNLVSLRLWSIPRSGYFSPEALVMGLSVTTQLKSFLIRFRSHFHTSNPCTPPLERTVLPALTHLWFYGFNEYLEDIAARIDTPVLQAIELEFFNRPPFEIPHLSHFVCRTSQLGSPIHARIRSDERDLSLDLTYKPLAGTPRTSPRQLLLKITSRKYLRRLSSLSQIISQLSPILSGVGQLNVCGDSPGRSGHGDLVSARWLELLRSFGGVERLCVYEELVLDIARTLQRVTSQPEPELFPNLRVLFLTKDSQEFTAALEAISPFISMRQLSAYPIAVFSWDRGTAAKKLMEIGEEGVFITV